MTEDEFSFHFNDKEIRGEKKNKINIYQDKSKEDGIFIPSLEMPKKKGINITFRIKEVEGGGYYGR